MGYEAAKYVPNHEAVYKVLSKLFKRKKKLFYRIFDAKVKNKTTNVETDEIMIMVSNHLKGFLKFDEVKNETLVKSKLEQIMEKMKSVHANKIKL